MPLGRRGPFCLVLCCLTETLSAAPEEKQQHAETRGAISSCSIALTPAQL